MLGIIIIAIKVILLLGVLITIHELGHFIVAKLCKVKVNEFAIGFGPTIWNRQGNETKYSIRLIPLGGYISMEGEEERSDSEGSFSNATIGKRIAIVVAGGLVNIVFGILIYYILTFSVGLYTSNIVDKTIEGFAAQNVGIQANDQILKINNKKIKNGKDITKALEKYENQELLVSVLRDNQIIEYKVEPSEVKAKYTGIYLKNENGKPITKIMTVAPKSPAEKAGLQGGDKILNINGNDINDDYSKLEEVLKNTEEKMDIRIERLGKEIDVTVYTEEKSTYYLGIYHKKVEPTFINRLEYSVYDTNDFLLSIFDNLKSLFMGKSSIKQFTGPVGISEMVAQTNEVQDFVYLVALISLSLGVTNLLPFPPLDGGKIVILLIEKLRRKPMSQELELKIQFLGFALMIILSIYVTYNDILRII